MDAIHVLALDLKTTETTKIELNEDRFKLMDEWSLAVKVSVPNLSWLPFGSINIPGFDVHLEVSCFIKTPDGDWQHDGMRYISCHYDRVSWEIRTAFPRKHESGIPSRILNLT